VSPTIVPFRSRAPRRRREAADVPSAAVVYHALCSLSPDAYAPLARMIVSYARAEAAARTADRTDQKNRRLFATSKKARRKRSIPWTVGDERKE
jgi:hypothetical protein